jgi:hypothetical protein
MSRRVLREIREPGTHIFYPLSKLLPKLERLAVWRSRDQIGLEIKMVSHHVRGDLQSHFTGLAPNGRL